MTPRPPPENPDDDKQSELLQATHDARNAIAPVNDPVEDQPATETQQAAPAEADKTKVEIDRIEAYLRGPTAFTA